MIEPIPNDVRKFSLKFLFLVMTTYAMAFAILAVARVYGACFCIALTAFWAGVGFMFVADSIDNRPVDERKLSSKSFGLLGALLVWVSMLAMVITLPAAAVEYRTSKIPASKKVYRDPSNPDERP